MKSQYQSTLRQGDRLGKYVIDRCIGVGGMGEVYLAHHHHLNSPFAIKLVKPGVLQSNPVFCERFLRETKLASRFQHPGCIAVFDADMEQNSGFLYMVMEYVDGQTLEQILSDGPLTELQALEIILAVAETLAAAAPLGLVHRDIKPANIMITRTGAVKLADLGVAKSTAGEFNVTLTMDNLMVGTAAYAAPEQLQDAHHVDVRADIYSLGVTLYEMLTLKVPFEGHNFFETMTMVLSNPVPDPRQYNPRIRQETVELLEKMLAKAPAQRPADAAALCLLLQPLLAMIKIQTPELQSLIHDRAELAIDQQRSTMATQEHGVRRKFRLVGSAIAAGLLVLLIAVCSLRSGFIRTALQQQTECRQKQVQLEELKQNLAAVKLRIAALQEELQHKQRIKIAEKAEIKTEAPVPDLEKTEAVPKFSDWDFVILWKSPDEQQQKKIIVKLPDHEEMELVWCPPGSFPMGSPLGEPGRRPDEVLHRVTISKGFWIGKYEVTQSQYMALMDRNPTSEQHVGLRHPVEVTWHEAVEYCRRFNEQEIVAGRLPEGYFYALPTEAHWEYACRAGVPGALSGAADSPRGCAVFDQPTFAKVGRLASNSWDICDMLGNAREWVMDRYSEYPQTAVTDPIPKKAGTLRIVRGGGVNMSSAECRAAARRALKSTTRDRTGFRIALIPGEMVKYDFK